MKFHRGVLTLIATGLLAPVVLADNPVIAEELPQINLPDFDALQLQATRTGELDIDGTNGNFSVTNYNARFILSRPIELFAGVQMLPIFTYGVHHLDFDSVGGTAFQDEELHSAAIQSMFFKKFDGTKWIGLAWTRAELASDYQGIQSDELTFDIAVGATYQFNDSFMLGFGVLLANLNGEDEIWWGPNFHWKPADNFQVGLYGPNLRAIYTVNSDWFIALNGEPNGGVWNFRDNAGESKSFELGQYLLGVSTHHRITGELWLSAGFGYVLPGRIEVRGNRGGGPLFERDTDGAPYVQVGLELRRW